ncbi:GNAT family N-acetyltransferase [Rugosimonospora africana]|uniref:N-acetyltransferase n=1 Tax=Rugosimonospora africana TaxID=556532 RepID=A0A8J3QTA3_9ACTN|nr:GNAT family N-acetyltransferase [Rugosimonospora africana]GIH16079.1 N-acetyltransferase [Rugosimonospora africana]
MNSPPTIRTASVTDAATVAYVVATAFHSLDVCQWLIPDPRERAARLSDYFRIITDHAFRQGTVHVTTDLNAVAVWLSCPFPDPAGYDTRLAAACGPWTARFQNLDEQMYQAHPHDRGPHDYLAFLAVMPSAQGKGLGSALVEHHHAGLDRQRRPAYLEASNARSRKLYDRAGYRDCAPPLDLPYQGESLFPMWREPARQSSPHADRAS